MGYGKGCTYDSKRDFEKYKISGFYTGFVMEGKEQEIKIQPNDLLSIIVNSRDPELVSIFNLPEVRLSAGQGTSAASSQIQ